MPVWLQVQNGAEDAGIAAASAKRQVGPAAARCLWEMPVSCCGWNAGWSGRVVFAWHASDTQQCRSLPPPMQAQAAEQAAGEAGEAAAAAALLAGGLQQELARAHEQLAALAEQQAASGARVEQVAQLVQQQVQEEAAALRSDLGESIAVATGAAAATAAAATSALAQTVDEVASQLAGLKLQLAQQHEAADAGDAGGRRGSDGGGCSELAQVQAQLAALEQRLEGLASTPKGRALANAAETAACLATLSDIVHRQREELQQVKAVMSSVGQDTAAVADAQRELGAQQQGAVAALQAAIKQLGQQAEAAAAASCRQVEQLEGMQRQLAAMQLSGAAVAGTSAAAAAAGASETYEQESGAHPALAAMQQRLERLEAAVAGEAGGHPGCTSDGGHSPAAAEASPACMADLQARIASLEAAVAGGKHTAGGQEARDQGMQAATQIAALAALVEGMQRQMDALVAAQQASATPAQVAAELVGGVPADVQQQVEARVGRAEATVAAALEELAGQIAALAARVDQAEAAALASAAPAQAAVSEAQQQVGAVQGFVSHQQLSRQASLRHSQQAEAGVQHSNGGGGLFARIGRSFSSQAGSRRSTGSCDSRDAAAASASGILVASAAAAALAEQGQADIPLRQRWSSSGEQDGGSRHSLSREASGRRTSGAAASGASMPRSSSGKFTPRSRAAGSGQWAAALQQERSGGSGGAGGGRSGRSTPRQEPSALSSFGDVALPLPQSSSCLVTPRWVAVPVGRARGSGWRSGGPAPRASLLARQRVPPCCFSQLPCLSPTCVPCREEAAERARAIEAELAGEALDKVQREVLAADLQRLRERLG